MTRRRRLAQSFLSDSALGSSWIWATSFSTDSTLEKIVPLVARDCIRSSAICLGAPRRRRPFDFTVPRTGEIPKALSAFR